MRSIAPGRKRKEEEGREGGEARSARQLEGETIYIYISERGGEKKTKNNI